MIWSLLGLACSALWANRLRSGLTLLGVIVGVTSVMTIISALEGMMGAVEKSLDRLGPTTFYISTIGGIITSEAQFLEMLKRKPLEVTNVDYIKEGCELCERVSPQAFGRARVKYRDNQLRDILIRGGTAEYIEIVDLEVSQGRFITREDNAHNRRVAFIGEDVRETLYEGLDALGKPIRINGVQYTVVGVAKKRGSMFGESQDDFVSIPFGAFWNQFGDPGRRGSILVKARSIEDLDDAMDQVRLLLRSRRHVPFDKEDDFTMMTADALLSQLNSLTAIFRMALVGISSISLVVGGIVVMNIMMVSVTERTREIGIRRSVGAKQKHILLQFLFEALLTTQTGGIIGIVIGFLVARFLVSQIDLDISPSAVAAFWGLFISTGVGLIFGIYPAMRASRLDPIKALSYE